MKTKQSTTKSLSGAMGGKTKMAGQSGAAPSVPGTIALGGRSSGNDFKASGGASGRMAGKSGAAPVQPGGVSVGGRADTTFGARGGKGKMAGYTGSQTAKGC